MVCSAKTYEEGQADYVTEVGAVAFSYFAQYGSDIATALGGEPEALVVVPSKRLDRSFDKRSEVEALLWNG